MNTRPADIEQNEMTTLSSCITKAVQDGYIDNYSIKDKKLYSPENDKLYAPKEVRIDNFYRFEGQSNPDDNAVLYEIQTIDGRKGLLTDAYGTYAEEDTSRFIKAVNDIHKEKPKDI